MSPTPQPRPQPPRLQITINGRLEHLRGSALGFRNLTHYIAYADFRISDGMSPSGLC